VPHADHRRSVPLAREGGRNHGLNNDEETSRFRASGRDVPTGTVAEAIPLRWLQGGYPSAIAPRA
jgi:hypothetical protein